MLHGVKRVTGFYDDDGPMVRVVFNDGSVIVGDMMPTMAALLRVGYYSPIVEKKPTLRVVGREEKPYTQV
ncbi:hypothetical protein [Paludifilum halophilum]|uniref:Uncharacterized protein n=1 Tax=Paludifilum halophilum TaxID=1642702 RepID=A0A235B8X9_9BACL|nr:hypothetical protein [Paludifilum halophilum]OYD08760.1 hypothetical protein CHM34_02890 [Paludifilum halophilum]